MFDSFTPFGVFRFSSKPSPCRKVYEQMREDMGPAFQGPENDAIIYGLSMGIGLAQVQFDAAESQKDPANCSVALPDKEREFQIFPDANATDAQRRADLVIADRVGGIVGTGSDTSSDVMVAIADGLRVILGDALIDVYYMIGTPDWATYGPTYNATDYGPIANAFAPIRTYKTAAALFRGSATTIDYTHLLTDGVGIKKGDVVTIEPGVFGREESAIVSSSTASSFVIDLRYCHPSGSVITTANFPHRASTARLTNIIVSSSVLGNKVLINKINEFMRKAMTAVSLWTITGGTIGNPTKFRVGTTPLGRSVIGLI